MTGDRGPALLETKPHDNDGAVRTGRPESWSNLDPLRRQGCAGGTVRGLYASRAGGT